MIVNVVWSFMVIRIPILRVFQAKVSYENQQIDNHDCVMWYLKNKHQ